MRRIAVVVVLVTGLVEVCGASPSAEGDKPTTEGPRVRVTAPGFANKPIVGTLITIDAKKVTVKRATASETVAIPRDAIAQLQISLKASGKRRGAAIGALAGAGVGAAIGLALGEDCGAPDAYLICYSRGATAAALGLSGLAIGSALGAVVAPGEKWEAEDAERLKARLTPVLGPRGRIGLVVALRF
jgi:hypothetical protein